LERKEKKRKEKKRKEKKRKEKKRKEKKSHRQHFPPPPVGHLRPVEETGWRALNV
jgi:hypothetical protein